MRSHLTRRVFRRLLANKPLVTHRQFHRPPQVPAFSPNGRVNVSVVHRRTFLGLFERPQRDLREPLLDPGMEKMLELDKRIHLVARLPPIQDLADAFNAFVKSKLARKSPIEDFHATRLLQTLRSIEDRNETGKESVLTFADLETACQAMEEKSGQAYTAIHRELAYAIWKAILARTRGPPSVDGVAVAEPEPLYIVPFGLIVVLCATGETAEARNILEAQAGSYSEDQRRRRWLQVLAGFAKEDNEPQLVRAVEQLDLQHSGDKLMFLYYSRKNEIPKAKKWLTPEALCPKNEDGEAVIDDMVYQALIEFCLRNKEMDWGQQIIGSMDKKDKTMPSEQLEWDAIFRATAASGRGVDEIDKMLNVSIRRAQESGQEFYPDINMFNSLIRIAVAKKDSYTAERYFRLAEKWNAQPNAETYILQVQYRIEAGDLDGATASYARLREERVLEDEDWSVMNQLVQTLATTPGIQNEIVMGLVEDLSERKRTFPADTVLALCQYHLQRDEYFEVVDLLQTYAYQFSISQRTHICNVLVDFTIDPATDTGRAWDTYMIFHQIFDIETKREARNKVMNSMFERRRPDLATHVFTRMNRHVRADSRPDVETYALAFEGISQTREPEALEVVHNLLKLDTETEPCTRLYNGLMMAHAACGAHVRALEFWDEIATSAEGPTYNSLHAVFKVCQDAPFGYRRAIPIWSKLRQADIDVDKGLFGSYLACLAGQAQIEALWSELDRMREITGADPDFFVIGAIFNAFNNSIRQEEIKKWTLERHPAIWEQVEQVGFEENEFGNPRVVGIDRFVRA